MKHTGRRLEYLITAFIALLFVGGVAWKMGYFATPKMEEEAFLNDQIRLESQPWELELQRQARDAEFELVPASIASNLSSLSEIQFPMGELAHPGREFYQRYFQFLQTEQARYQETTKDSKEAQAAALAFLEKALAFDAKLLPRSQLSEVQRLAKLALEAGTQDPMIRFYIANFQDDDWENLIQPAADQLLANQASLLSRMAAREALLRLARFRNADRLQQIQEELETLLEWMQVSSQDAEQQRFVWIWWNSLWENATFNPERQLIYDRCCQAKGAYP